MSLGYLNDCPPLPDKCRDRGSLYLIEVLNLAKCMCSSSENSKLKHQRLRYRTQTMISLLRYRYAIEIILLKCIGYEFHCLKNNFFTKIDKNSIHANRLCRIFSYVSDYYVYLMKLFSFFCSTEKIFRRSARFPDFELHVYAVSRIYRI